MIYGYARVSTDGQSVAAQVQELRAAGADKVFRETASGAKGDRVQQRTTIAVFDALCSLAKKHGRVFPSHEGIAYPAKCSKNTVIAALKQLEFFGFVTVRLGHFPDMPASSVAPMQQSVEIGWKPDGSL